MANLTIQVPDAAVPRILDAFAAEYSYQDNVPDGSGGSIPNPETRQQFAVRMIRDYLKNVTASHEGKLAQNDAINQVRSAIG